MLIRRDDVGTCRDVRRCTRGGGGDDEAYLTLSRPGSASIRITRGREDQLPRRAVPRRPVFGPSARSAPVSARFGDAASALDVRRVADLGALRRDVRLVTGILVLNGERWGAPRAVGLHGAGGRGGKGEGSRLFADTLSDRVRAELQGPASVRRVLLLGEAPRLARSPGERALLCRTATSERPVWRRWLEFSESAVVHRPRSPET